MNSDGVQAAQNIPNANQQPPPQQGRKFNFFQMIIVYYIINYLISHFMGNKTNSNPNLFKNAFENNEPFVKSTLSLLT